LLRDPQTRNALLDLLPTAEALELAELLQLPEVNPYQALRAAKIRKGSAAERDLFAFLGVVPTELDEPEQQPPVVESDADYSLFAHQRTAARKAETLLGTTPRRVLLHMPTGSGKTRTAMHLVARELRRREPCLVIWLAFSEELCEQAAAEFEAAWKFLGDRSVSVYRFWGQRSLPIAEIGDGFMVAGLAKTYAAAKNDMNFLMRLSDRSSLVVIDEAHQAIAESYHFVLRVLIERSEQSQLLGLTATPGRTWNEPDEDLKLAEFFGRNKVTLEVSGFANPVDYLIETGYLARPRFEALPYSSTETLSTSVLAKLASSLDVTDDVLKALASDEQRNLLIVNRIEQLIRNHQRVLVFAATVTHARILASVLKARDVKAYALTAITPPGERSRLIAKYKSEESAPIVLCNFGVLTTGFDAPRTSAAVIARPTKSLVLFSQMVGRATRGPRVGGNAEAEVVTVVDTSLPGFREMSDTFLNWEDVW